MAYFTKTKTGWRVQIERDTLGEIVDRLRLDLAKAEGRLED